MIAKSLVLVFLTAPLYSAPIMYVAYRNGPNIFTDTNTFNGATYVSASGIHWADGSQSTSAVGGYSPVLCTLPQVSLGASCSEPSNITGNALYATTAGYTTSAGSATYVLGSNVVGAVANATNSTTANYAANAGSSTYIMGSNVVGAVANATNATTAANATTENYATNAGSATYITGGNVVGTVASATTASGLSGALSTCIQIASQTATSGSVSFSATWKSSTTYHIVYNLLNGSSSNFGLTINADNGAHYTNSVLYSSSGTLVGAAGAAANGAYYALLNPDPLPVYNGGILKGFVDCQTEYGNSKNVRCDISSNYDASASLLGVRAQGSSVYRGASSFSGITLSPQGNSADNSSLVTSGTYRGFFALFQCETFQ